MTVTDLHHEAEVAVEPTVASRLRPAALARVVDLPGLRHDFPLVLTEHADRPVTTLTDVVDRLLTEIAPVGARGERLRQHVLRLETAIRRQLDDDPGQPLLTAAWDRASEALLAAAHSAELADSLAAARHALAVDGRLVPADADAPVAVLRHLHARAEAPRAAALHAELAELARRLAAVLALDEQRSARGRDPDRLRAGIGTPHEADFDFRAWAEVVGSRPHETPLSDARRTRIEWALGVLQQQRFVASDPEQGPPHAFRFEFDSCAGALRAHHERLPDLARVVKAAAIAELELDNAYDEATHGAYFHAFDADALRTEDLLPFPRYLVLLDADELDAAARARVLDVLASPLPCTMVLTTPDPLGAPPPHDPLTPRPLTGVGLTTAALGLGTARVVQTTTAGLARSTPALRAALADAGPVLVSVVTAIATAGPDLHPYLAAAATTEARVAPEYSYEPRGDDGQARLTLAPIADPVADWPVHPISFEDEHLQRRRDELAFTVADLLATDPRCGEHATVWPRHTWTDAMVPVAEFLELDTAARRDRVPYVLAVDGADVLRRVVVDEQVVAAAAQVRASWRRLQELAGVRATEERRLLAEERAALEAARDEGDSSVRAATAVAETESGPVDSATPGDDADDGRVTPAPEGEEPPSTDAWIETARCTTCDECTTINPRMFAYNDEKQAYIADLRAGTFGELVQAAEACQVAIIHPGEPWDPDEQGLADLRRRAASFA